MITLENEEVDDKDNVLNEVVLKHTFELEVVFTGSIYMTILYYLDEENEVKSVLDKTFVTCEDACKFFSEINIEIQNTVRKKYDLNYKGDL